MSIHSSLSLVTQTCPRDKIFSGMVQRLVQWKPLAFGILDPDDSKIILMRMQSRLGLRPSFCCEAYCYLAQKYALDPAEITQWWIYRHDISLGQLYHRLWHEHNMAEMAFYRQDYVC